MTEVTRPGRRSQGSRVGDEFQTPRVIVGTWQLSEGHHRESTGTEAVLDAWRAMAEAGLTVFDCGDIYTGVEALLGRFLRREHERGSAAASRLRIHTKFVPDRDSLRHLTKRDVETIIDRSLRRLGIERLYLVQLAWWDYAIPKYVETAQWLGELQRAGKIAHIGATNFNVEKLAEILGAGVSLVSHQVQYSLLDHRPERGMTDLCQDHCIQLLCYGTLAGGFLSDRWVDAPEPAANLPNRSLTKYKLIIDEYGGWTAYQALLTMLRPIAQKHGVGIGTVAARYVLERPQVGAVILGARNDRHLEDTMRILRLELDEEDTSTLRRIAAHRAPQGDVYDLERQPEGAHAAIMRYNLNRAAPDNRDSAP